MTPGHRLPSLLTWRTEVSLGLTEWLLLQPQDSQSRVFLGPGSIQSHQGQSSSTTVPLATMPKETERHNYAGIEKQRDHQEAFGGHQHITSEHSLLHSLAGTFSPFNR